MEYTEEVKTEAERVVNTYSFLTDHFGNFDILCAIQDRQSVLEELQKWFKLTHPSEGIFKYLSARKTDLLEQINYLKSKI